MSRRHYGNKNQNNTNFNNQRNNNQNFQNNNNNNNNNQNFQNNNQNFQNNNNNQNFNNNNQNFNNNNNQNFNNNNNQNSNYQPRNNNNNNNNNNNQNFNNNNPNNKPKINSNRTTVQISGHDPTWDFPKFQGTLNSIISVRWLSNNFKPNQQIIEVQLNQNDASRFVQRVNNARVGNITLYSQFAPNAIQQTTDGTNLSTVLRTITIGRHPTTNQCMIDLSSLTARCQQSNASFSWDNKGHTKELISILLHSANDAIALTLANNNLDLSNYRWLSQIFQSCPHITSIDLTGNTCTQVKGLITLFNDIKHLITNLLLDPTMLQNIWQSCNFHTTNNATFSLLAVHTWLLDQFPTITSLNNQKIKPFIKLSSQPPRALSFKPAQSQFIDAPLQFTTNSPNCLPVEFAMWFLQQFDTNRAGLTNMYNDTSTFSLSVGKDLQTPATGQLENWSIVLRNGLTSWNSASIIRGQQSIISLFQTYPATVHDTDSATLDAICISTSEFLIQISGRFLEQYTNNNNTTSHLRSFSRSIVVHFNPTTGSSLIQSDMLYLHSNVKTDKQ